MNIPLDVIKKDFEQIQTIQIIVSFGDTVKILNITTEHILFLCKNNFPFLSIHDSILEGFTALRCDITYSSGFKTSYPLEANADRTKPALVNNTINQYLRINLDCPNPNTTEGKDRCFADIQALINNIEFISDNTFGEKNLIYYTVYGADYVKLLEQSLLSLKTVSNIINYDILIIADSTTQTLINKLDIIKDFTLHYMHVHEPIDGIDASINKLKIYNFEKINDYRKVIFLDCDILVLKDINTIFDTINVKNKLYVINNPEVIRGSYTSFYHGLQYSVDVVTQKALDLNYYPFNAGQFMFINSNKMRSHFENMRFFIKNWPSLFFFEQSFMNYYGVFAEFLRYDISNNNLVCLANATKPSNIKVHTDDNILIHFISPALDGATKLAFIKEYRSNFDS